MSRSKLIFASLVVIGIAALYGWHWWVTRPFEFVDADAEEGGKGKENGPTEWFMDQRLWPDTTFHSEDYLAAARQAEQLSRHHATLDDPTWVPAGPNNIGGRVADVIGHPTNTNLYYIAAASGGIWKTLNGGSSWTPIFDAYPSMSMGALAMDVQHPDTIYAGTGEACASGYSYFGTGVYKTTDGGTTWANVGLTDSRYIARIVIDPNDNQSIWVAAAGEFFGTNNERGIYHSTDGGGTWTNTLFVNDSTGATDVVIHPTNSQILYAAMWQRIRTPQDRRAGGRGSGVFRTTDWGQTWTRLQNGLPAQADTIGRIGLTISQSNPNVLYAIYADHPGNFLGIFKTTNGGDSWTETNDSQLADLYSSYGWYFGQIRVRPDNENVVFAMGVGMVRSTNGGQTWLMIANDVHVDHHAMWFRPDQPQTILEGNDGGFYRSTNNGSNWTFLTGLPINQFYAACVDFQHPERRYGGTQDQGSMRTQTGGLSDWEQIYGGDGFYTLVDPENSNTIYAEYQYGGLGRSTDNGGTWYYVLDGIDPTERVNWSMPVVFAPNDPNTLYCGTDRVYRTTNQGDMWTAISEDLTSGGGSGNVLYGTVSTIGVSPVHPNIIYAGTDDSHVWVTRNGGTTWTDISAGLPQRYVTRVAPDPIDSSAVFVTISGFQNAEEDAHLFYSDNFGSSWQERSGDLPTGPLNDVVRDPAIPGRLYTASDFGTYYSNDLGMTWIPLGLGLPRLPVMQLVLHNPTRQLVAATYGRSMFALNLDEIEAVPQNSDVPASYLLVSVYPNPFNAVANIDFRIPKAGNMEIAVYDLTGRKAATLLSGYQPAGRARVQWAAQNFATGTYLIRLTAAGQTRVSKALLIR
jgi:photosystem II stability/assembly factor-like uncharacterized protein